MSSFMFVKKLIDFPSTLYHIRNLSNKSAVLTKPRRTHYLRQYPTIVVEPDGSTFTVRHDIPRRIIKLPIDLSTLSEADRALVLENRKPKKKVIIQTEDKDNFDHSQYLRLLKKK